ncbi:MAG: hypothetical protein JXP73_14870 [Deltaproteobacteria bacterium]|nr:hypothetical protein [Deltaproteobacteria bacterium]
MKRVRSMKLALRKGASRAFVVGPLTFLLVAGAGCPSLFESNTQRAAKIRKAVPGTDGEGVVNAADTTVNTYATLAANVAAGATTITVGNIGDLTFQGRGLADGDLLLIVQMQGATIDTTDTVDYGTVADLGSAGLYEFVGVEGVTVASDEIALSCPLKHAYTTAGRTQVIRVPQYTTLTIQNGGSIIAPAWNGATGGIVAVHAQTTVQLDGTINVSGRGFRGGAVDNSSAAAGTGVVIYRSTSNQQGAEKGESIAGYQGGYTNGRYGRGAPANGGGGGNSHNAGGGGGANAGDLAGWRRGQGVMLDTVEGAAAWELDPGYIDNPVTANTRTNSEGGGRGGYSYSSSNEDALSVAPGDTDWGGNYRREAGGLGGRPLVNSPTGRLFMGGGGGAGDRNNGSTGSAGGRGGGIVILLAGSIAGTGSILADGATAPDTPAGTNGGDAPGGGGGGGTVVVNVATLSAIDISANGGGGGTQTGSSSQNEVEGPGGGGGGGYIAVSGTGSPNLSVAGGLGGTTNRTALEEFPCDGATAGHAGQTSRATSSFIYCGALPVTTIESHPSDPSGSAVGVFTFSNTSSPVTYECMIDSGSWEECEPEFSTDPLPDGSHTLSVRATDSFGNVEATPVTFTWDIDAALLTTTIATHPPLVSNTSDSSFTFTNTVTPVTYECKIDDGEWATCDASFTTGDLPDGTHTLYVRATDSTPITEDPPASYTWTIDTVLPDTSIASNPASSSASSSATFTFESDESPVTFECKLDTADYAECDATYTATSLADGTHTLSVRAKDAAGNLDDSPATYSWDVNTALPVTTIATHPPLLTNSPSGVFTFTNTRSPVTYECKIDDGDWASCEASHTTDELPDGEHTLSVRASVAVGDAGSLVEDPPVTYTWTIDTAPPDTSIGVKPDDPSASSVGVFGFASPDSPVTFECRLDGGEWEACDANYATPALPNGSHTLEVRAKDAAGNVDPEPATYAWVIDAVDLDAGALDGGRPDAGVVLLDGAVVSLDGGPALDGGGEDARVVVDAGERLDVPDRRDLGDAVARDVAEDGRDAAAEARRDTGPSAPDASPDAAVPPPKEDAAPPVNEDAAAPVVTEVKILGGGFCAVSPARTASPAGFALLALAGLALLRRRRRP